VEQKVRQALQEVLMTGDMPLTAANRARVAQEVCEIIGA
jgi:pilus assembly protein CpaF